MSDILQKLNSRKSLLKSETGFTLLETVLYVSILSFILASLLGITYQSLESTDKISKKIAEQQEANFLIRKFEWAINGADNACLSGGDLKILRSQSPTQVLFKKNLANKSLDIDAGLGSLSLNSQNVVVDNINFPPPSGNPKSVTLSFDLNGQTFSLSKYIRNENPPACN
jgi:type II secretory pathway pseudopilin PulG